MRIDILTLFPELCETFSNVSIIGRARKKGAIEICCHQIRDYAFDKHKHVDGILYGGGKGMLMLAEPIALCFEALCRTLSCRPRFIYMSPKGRILDQEKVKELSEFPNLAILCGHYEGVDERLIDDFVDEQISVGDYVVTGGELPALMLTDAISRLIPGVLSDKECFEKESHFNGLLEYPQYARPELWRERPVPEVLLSGHHEKINEWRTKQSLIETAEKRPDLLKNLFI